jgi:hypothetical protein
METYGIYIHGYSHRAFCQRHVQIIAAYTLSRGTGLSADCFVLCIKCKEALDIVVLIVVTQKVLVRILVANFFRVATTV